MILYLVFEIFTFFWKCIIFIAIFNSSLFFSMKETFNQKTKIAFYSKLNLLSNKLWMVLVWQIRFEEYRVKNDILCENCSARKELLKLWGPSSTSEGRFALFPKHQPWWNFTVMYTQYPYHWLGVKMKQDLLMVVFEIGQIWGRKREEILPKPRHRHRSTSQPIRGRAICGRRGLEPRWHASHPEHIAIPNHCLR